MLVGIVITCSPHVIGAEPSLDLRAEFGKLASEDFAVREGAQAALATWALQDPTQSASIVLAESLHSEDPEVRERCQAILRRLADAEYATQGEGYIGIRMMDELTAVPGQAKPRWGIRVLQVVAGSAAEQAGMQMNDVVVGMVDFNWPAGEATAPFRERVMQFKPGDRIVLEVLRDRRVERVAVKLGKMPAILKQGIRFGGAIDSPQAVEERERDAFYRKWLEKLMANSKLE